MMTGTPGRAALAFGNSSRPLISRHVDVGKDQDQRCSRHITDELKGAVCRLRKIHREAAVADVASESLAKQRLDIGFVVNNKNKQAHLSAPALPPAAGRHARKENLEFCKFARLRVDFNRPRMLLD